MIGRVKDYVCLTSVSLMLNLAVSVIRRVRHKHTAVLAVPNLGTRLNLQESTSTGV